MQTNIILSHLKWKQVTKAFVLASKNCKYISGWTQYYDVGIEERYENREFESTNSPPIPKLGNIFVFNCYFHDLFSKESGGAVLCENCKNLLVQKCFFVNCSTSEDQSSIRVLTGNSVIKQTCGLNDKAQDRDSFSGVYGDSTINYVFDSSVSHCQAGSAYTMIHTNGQVQIRSVNLSFNSANTRSALGCEPNTADEDTNIGSIVSYSLFLNNTSIEDICIWLTNVNKYGCKHEMKYCNIIENNANNTIWCRGEINITHTCILQNIAPYFSTYDRLAKIYLYYCNIDNMKSDSVDISVVATTSPFTNTLNLFSPEKCKIIFFTPKNHNFPWMKDSNYFKFFIYSLIEFIFQ